MLASKRSTSQSTKDRDLEFFLSLKCETNVFHPSCPRMRPESPPPPSFPSFHPPLKLARGRTQPGWFILSTGRETPNRPGHQVQAFNIRVLQPAAAGCNGDAGAGLPPLLLIF